MITHVALIGADAAVAEIRDAAIGDPSGPTIVLTLGPSLAIHMGVDMAESIADALVDAITVAGEGAPILDCAGPVAYLPTWVPA